MFVYKYKARHCSLLKWSHVFVLVLVLKYCEARILPMYYFKSMLIWSYLLQFEVEYK